jgi:hypothetical protein
MGLNCVMSILGVSITAWGDCNNEEGLDATYDGFLKLDNSCVVKRWISLKVLTYNNYISTT